MIQEGFGDTSLSRDPQLQRTLSIPHHPSAELFLGPQQWIEGPSSFSQFVIELVFPLGSWPVPQALYTLPYFQLQEDV